MKLRLKEFHLDQCVGVSDFNTREELEAHKAKLLSINPDATFTEEDISGEEVKEEKRKLAKATLDSFEFKGKTIAELRVELNEKLKLEKEMSK